MNKKNIILILFISLLVVGCTYEEPKNNKKLTNKKLEQLSYKVPKSFEKSKLSTETSSFYDYIDKSHMNSCTLSVITIDPYTKDLEQIIKTYMYSDEDFIIKDKKINNIKWKYAKNERSSNIIYYVYTTIYNNKIYVIQYDDLRPGDYCDYAYKKIIKSLKFEE